MLGSAQNAREEFAQMFFDEMHRQRDGMENEMDVCHFLFKKGGEMAAGSINILDFAASGGSWGYFGRSAPTKR